MMILERLERTIKNPNHPNTEHENVHYSDGFGIRMVGIRAPTVVTIHQKGFFSTDTLPFYPQGYGLDPVRDRQIQLSP